jgi:HK97 family phage major capsid protein
MDMLEIKNAIAAVSADIKAEGAKALEAAQKAQSMTAEQKESVDKMLVKQGELQAQVMELEQKAARRTTEEGAGVKSLGEMFTTNDGFKKAHEDGSIRRSGGRFGIEIDRKAIVTANTGAGIIADRQPGVLMIPQRPLAIRDLVAPGRTNSNLITYMKETLFTNNAAPVAEGARKPESTMTLAQSTAPVVKLAHFMKASTEILDDFPALQSLINERLTYGLKLVEDNQLLNGSGVGNNLNGIYTQATAYAAPLTVAGETRIDRLRLALLQSELALLPSDGIVLHPSDWAAIELLKDTQGHYLIGNPQGSMAATLWRRPVVETQAMALGKFLVGAFRTAAQIFDRTTASMSVATENEDDFVNNLVTMLIEERLALVVSRPQAFIKGDTVPA